MKAQRSQCKIITTYKNCLHNYATKIQSFYRSYKKRKYLNNIYIKLPDDIQNHILYFIKQEFYLNKLNNKLDVIVSNKINIYIIDFNNKINIDKNLIPFSLLTYLANDQKNILHIYKLFVKYQSILTYKYYYYNNIINNLENIYTLLNNYEHRIINAYSNHIYQLAYVLYYRLDSIINKLDYIMNPNTKLSSIS